MTANQSSPNGDGPRAYPATLRILLVDDDDVDRLAVRRYLLKAGLSVELDEATSPAEMLGRIRSVAYDCILLDHFLPGTESPALLRRIREASPEAPVIILTGRGDEQIAVELMKAGAADYVPKAALSADRLASSLRYTLETARATARRHASRVQEGLRGSAVSAEPWEDPLPASRCGRPVSLVLDACGTGYGRGPSSP